MPAQPTTCLGTAGWMASAVLLVLAHLVPGSPAVAQPPAEERSNDQEDEQQPLPLTEWSPVALDEIVLRIEDWAVSRADAAGAAKVLQRWNELSAGDEAMPMVQALLFSAAEIAPEVADIMRRLDDELNIDHAQQFVLELTSSGNAPLVAENLKLWTAVRLAQHGLFDESLAVIETIDAAHVIDPATLLFFRGVAEHQLVKLREARASLESLTAPDYPLPARYDQLARLMIQDLEQIEPDSLGAIARQMSDVRRRLALGAADKQVQVLEDDIVDQIDKMIEKVEQQMKQQQQQPMNGPPSSPPDDSRIAGQPPADGDVDIRDIGRSAGWGDLPPKERERIIQQIGREFPSHYRDVIEEYFRRLATEQREQEQAQP